MSDSEEYSFDQPLSNKDIYKGRRKRLKYDASITHKTSKPRIDIFGGEIDFSNSKNCYVNEHKYSIYMLKVLRDIGSSTAVCLGTDKLSTELADQKLSEYYAYKRRKQASTSKNY